MAHWTKPKTWITGERIIASSLNTHLRDNLDFLQDRDRVHAIQTQDNALKNDEWECIDFGGESFEAGGMHSSRKRSKQISVRQDGVYYFLFKIGFEQTDTVDIETVAADVATEKFTKNSHGLENGDVVRLSSLGTLTGVSTGTDYYVVQASTTDTFKISTTLGGTPEDLTGANANITVTQQLGERSVMLRRNSNQSETGGHQLGTWTSAAVTGSTIYVDGDVLARMKKGDHVNLFVKQNSGRRGLKALSGSSGTSYLQAVQMGG
jgi:hypothetical protein